MKFSYKKDAVSGVKWTGLSTLIITGGNLLFILYLTQVLSKVDFGLFALVNVVAVLASEFVDMGIGQAIVQKKEVNHDQLSTLYWINLALGLVVTAAVFFSSELVASFYESPELVTLLQWTSIGFLASAFGAQYQALFQKKLQFRRMALIDIVSFAAYVVSTVVFIYLGYGILGLIWGGLFRTGIKALLSVVIGLKMHIPSLYFNYGKVTAFLSFGSFRAGAFLVSFLGGQLDAILIGKFLGVAELGIYDVLKRLAIYPIRVVSPIIKKVSYPILAKVHTDRQRATDMFVKILKLINMLRFPIFLGIVLCAQEITALLGGDWESHYVLLQLLALFFMFNTIQGFVGQSMIAMGKSDWGFYNNLVQLPLNIAVIYFGSFWGIEGIAMAFLIKALLLIYPRYYIFIKRLFDLSVGMYTRLIFKDLILLGIAVAVIMVVMGWLGLNALLSLIFKAILFGLAVLAVYFCFERDQFRYLLSLLRS